MADDVSEIGVTVVPRKENINPILIAPIDSPEFENQAPLSTPENYSELVRETSGFNYSEAVSELDEFMNRFPEPSASKTELSFSDLGLSAEDVQNPNVRKKALVNHLVNQGMIDPGIGVSGAVLVGDKKVAKLLDSDIERTAWESLGEIQYQKYREATLAGVSTLPFAPGVVGEILVEGELTAFYQDKVPHEVSLRQYIENGQNLTDLEIELSCLYLSHVTELTGNAHGDLVRSWQGDFVKADNMVVVSVGLEELMLMAAHANTHPSGVSEKMIQIASRLKQYWEAHNSPDERINLAVPIDWFGLNDPDNQLGTILSEEGSYRDNENPVVIAVEAIMLAQTLKALYHDPDSRKIFLDPQNVNIGQLISKYKERNEEYVALAREIELELKRGKKVGEIVAATI